jgi:hypothetical protein
MLGALKSGLVAWYGRGTLEVDVAIFTAEGSIEALVTEVELETELVAVESE